MRSSVSRRTLSSSILSFSTLRPAGRSYRRRPTSLSSRVLQPLQELDLTGVIEVVRSDTPDRVLRRVRRFDTPAERGCGQPGYHPPQQTMLVVEEPEIVFPAGAARIEPVAAFAGEAAGAAAGEADGPRISSTRRGRPDRGCCAAPPRVASRLAWRRDRGPSLEGSSRARPCDRTPRQSGQGEARSGRSWGACLQW
jgi:hypothetical protein